MKSKALFLSLVLCPFFNCSKQEKKKTSFEWKTIEVTATAYNSLAYQTDSDPNITAYGDSLQPGLKSIAVSRDLLKLGMKHNTPIVIEGLKGLYFVNDKMNRRWTKRVDIYMGDDVNAAKQWGRKKIILHYRVEVTLQNID